MTNRSLLFETKFLTVKIKNNYIIKDLCIEMKKAERVALVGTSGAGKTITALALLGLLNRLIPEAEINGEIYWFIGKENVDRPVIGYVPQGTGVNLNPYLPIKRQVLELIFPSRLIDSNESQLMDEAWNLFHTLGLIPQERVFKLYPHELSGGMQQRILIAIALLAHPDILILDEPTTSLDTVTRASVHKVLFDYMEEKGTSLLLITHNIDEARILSDRIFTLSGGSITEGAPVKAIFKQPVTNNNGQVTPTSPVEADIKDQSDVDRIPRRILNNNSDIFLMADNVSISIDKQLIVNGFSATIKRFSRFGVMGETGSGKTTLIRGLSSLIPLQKGDLIFDNHTLSNLDQSSIRYLRRYFQVCFQDPNNALNPYMTIEELIHEPAKIYGFEEPSSDEIRSALQIFELTDDILKRYPSQLSFGQKQRLALLRLLFFSRDIKLVYMDEPMSGLDSETWQKVLNVFIDQYSKLTFFIVSHDLEFIRSFCKDIAVLWGGRVVELIYGYPWEFVHPYSRLLWEASSIISTEHLEQFQNPLSRISKDFGKIGCPFMGICQYSKEECKTWEYRLDSLTPSHFVACSVCHNLKGT